MPREQERHERELATMDRERMHLLSMVGSYTCDMVANWLQHRWEVSMLCGSFLFESQRFHLGKAHAGQAQGSRTATSEPQRGALQSGTKPCILKKGVTQDGEIASQRGYERGVCRDEVPIKSKNPANRI